MNTDEKSTFGLSENIAGMLCYLGGWVTGLIFMVCERKNKTVRFHALQSLVWFGALSIVTTVVTMLSKFWIIGILFGIVGGILGFVWVVTWLFLMLMAYTGKTFHMPILGDAVERTISK